MSGSMMGSPGPSEHETVGAYALGILDDAEATAFEAHLATCEWCAQQLDELAGMEPMMAALADLPGAGSPAIGESLSARPSPRLAERLVDEVSERRARKRRKGFYLVAAAAALIIGGPLTVMSVNGGSDSGKTATPLAAGAKAAFSTLSDKVTATDPSTKVTATVAMQEKEWGTWGVVEAQQRQGPAEVLAHRRRQERRARDDVLLVGPEVGLRHRERQVRGGEGASLRPGRRGSAAQ